MRRTSHRPARPARQPRPPLRRAAGLLALGAGVILAGLAAAQHALDAGLGSSRVNAPAAQPMMNKPLYTVNRQTGTMQYNEANAFNDPTYNIHQRYTMDRFEYFDAGSGGARAGGARPTVSGNLGSPRAQAPARTQVPVAGMPQASRSSGGALVTPLYGSSRSGSGSLAAPRYSVSNYSSAYTGAPRSGRVGAGVAGAGQINTRTPGLAMPTYKVSGGGGGGRRR